MFILDYTIQNIEERKKIVNEIISKIGEENLKAKDLERLANYLIFSPDIKNENVITKGRMNTINKREIYTKDQFFEYTIQEEKNKIAAPHITITKKDLQEIPLLKQLHDSIIETEKIYQKTKNKKVKKMLIEMRKDQYIIKNSYKKPIFFLNPLKSSTVFNYDEDTWYYTKDGRIKEVSENRLNLFNPKHISEILHRYSALKQHSYFDLDSDIKWIIQDLENIIEKYIKNKYPMFYEIIILKIDGQIYEDIRKYINEKYNKSYTIEYLSYLYRHKIPNIITKGFKEEYIQWFYTYKTKGEWKACSLCRQVKLLHPLYFSKNKGSKNGYYTICKECRRKKKMKEK